MKFKHTVLSFLLFFALTIQVQQAWAGEPGLCRRIFSSVKDFVADVFSSDSRLNLRIGRQILDEDAGELNGAFDMLIQLSYLRTRDWPQEKADEKSETFLVGVYRTDGGSLFQARQRSKSLETVPEIITRMREISTMRFLYKHFTKRIVELEQRLEASVNEEERQMLERRILRIKDAISDYDLNLIQAASF